MPWGAALVRALVDTTDDAVFGSDAEGRVTTWNRSAERIAGFRAGEAVGMLAADLFSLHLRGELATVFARAAEGERVNHFETEIRRKDGFQVPVLLSLCPVLDDDCTEIVTVVVARDITEQRLAQARLAEVEDRIRESEALGRVGSWLWDVGTDTMQWSDEFHRIHGVDPLDFGGTLEAHLGVVHPDDRGWVHGSMLDAVTTSRPFDDEYRVVLPDGTQRRVHARAQPTFDSAGVVVALRGIGQVVTDLS